MASKATPLRRLGKNGGWILLVFIGVFIPLWGFGAMVDGLREGEVFIFDLPILRALHSIANTRFDRAALAISALGYAWGIIPADALLVLGLALAKRTREMTFAGVSIIGSLALNLAVKHLMERSRPSLWESLVHETSYSFPSGHAMASMTLAWVVVLLCWSRKSQLAWKVRWPITLAAAVFVVMV